MIDVRCPCCKTKTQPGRLLFKATDVALLEIKCPRCGALLKIKITNSEQIVARVKA